MRRIVHYWLAHPPRSQRDIRGSRPVMLDGTFVEGPPARFAPSRPPPGFLAGPAALRRRLRRHGHGARLSYGRSFQILIAPGEWAAVALMLALYAVSAARYRKPAD